MPIKLLRDQDFAMIAMDLPGQWRIGLGVGRRTPEQGAGVFLGLVQLGVGGIRVGWSAGCDKYPFAWKPRIDADMDLGTPDIVLTWLGFYLGMSWAKPRWLEVEGEEQ